MIAYICDLIGDALQDAPCDSSVFPGEVVGEDLSSSVLEIRDETQLIQCVSFVSGSCLSLLKIEIGMLSVTNGSRPNV